MRSMTVENEGDSLAVIFLDSSISEEVRIMEIGDDLAEIASRIPAGQALTLSFQNVEYFSSAMVGQLVRLRNTIKKCGVEMRLRHLSPTIQDILRAMHLENVFRIENSNA